MKKRVFTLAVAVLLMLSAFPLAAFADSGACIVAENYTVKQGGTAYVYLWAKNFDNVAALDIEVYYDSTVMSVNSTGNGNFLSGASVSCNTDVPGVVKISTISVTGLSGNGLVMLLCFKVNADCPAGEYPVTVTVGDAYDGDMFPYAISGVSGAVTVTPAMLDNFPVYISKNTSNVQQGDTLTVTVRHNSSQAFASANFYTEYDRDLFRVTGVELDSALTQENAVYSVNTDNPGIVTISFASMNAVTAYTLYRIHFEVIADTDAQAALKFSTGDVYTDDLIAYPPYTTTSTVSLNKKAVLPDYPDVTVETDRLIVGKESAAEVTLQAEANVAAGDFTVTYDPRFFTVSNVTASAETAGKGALIVLDAAAGEGNIKFSYVNPAGSFSEEVALINFTLTPIAAPDGHSAVSVSGTGVCDVRYNDVLLDYVAVSDCVFTPAVTESTCTVPGRVDYTCSCGENYSETLPLAQHAYAADCDENCDVCGEFRQTAISHTYADVHDDTCDLCERVRVLQSVSVSAPPNKTVYLEGKDALDLSGGKLSLVYDDGSGGAVEMTEEMVSGFDNTRFGEQVLTVSYGGKTTTFTVTVKAKSLTGITVTDMPSKLTYFEGEAFDGTGMVVTAVYDNGTSETVTGYALSGYDPTPGTKTVTVSYGGKTTSFTVTVEHLPTAEEIGEQVQQALSTAKPGDTVVLTGNAKADVVVVKSGVTLDLNGYTLDTGYLAAFGYTVNGTVKAPKDHVVFTSGNTQLPIWNGEAYVLTKAPTFQQMHSVKNNALTYIFLPTFDARIHELLAAGADASNVKITVRLSWNPRSGGTASQDFVFADKFVKNVIDSYKNGRYGQVYTITLGNAAILENLQLSAVVVSDTGVTFAPEIVTP